MRGIAGWLRRGRAAVAAVTKAAARCPSRGKLGENQAGGRGRA